MNCEQARDAMLEAEPTALAATDDSALAAHLRACATCGRRARAILDRERALAAALDARGPRRPADDVLRAARAAESRRAAPRRRGWRVAAPLALAAGIGGLLLLTDQEQPVSPASALGPASPLPPFAVQGPPDRTVTVFRTNDPNIVVIWYF